MSKKIYTADSTLKEISAHPVGKAFTDMVKYSVLFFAKKKGTPEVMANMYFKTKVMKCSLNTIRDYSQGALTDAAIERLLQLFNAEGDI